MYRIGINASFLRKPYTGIGQVTANVLREIARRESFPVGGQEVDAKEFRWFVYLDEPDTSGVPERFSARPLGCMWKRDDLARKFLFERFLIPHAARRDRLDAFVSLYQSATVIPRLSGIRHAMVVHDIIPEVLPEYLDNARKRFFWKRMKHGMKRAEKILAVSSHTEKDLIKHVSIAPERISVAPIDVDPIFSEPVSRKRLFTVKSHYGLGDRYFLVAGGLEARKNVENTILGYEKLLDMFGSDTPDLAVAGTLLPHLAPLVTDVETLVRERNLTQKVKILGTVAQHDMPVIYAGAIAAVFASRYEGFGMPVLEAMRAGTPVITTKRTSIPEVAGDAARYCGTDTADIARALEEVMEDETLRAELRRRGTERAKLFSWERFADDIVKSLHLENK